MKANVDPILTDILKLYEKDEARHIALGVKHLPNLIRKMQYNEIASLFIWQLRLMMLEIDGLNELRHDFESLGFSVDEVYYLAEKKQIEAAKSMGDELGLNHALWSTMQALASFKKDLVIHKKYGQLSKFMPF